MCRNNQTNVRFIAAKCVMAFQEDGYVPPPRRIGVQDTRAVHEPNRNVAAGVAPQNVALAVTVEVAGSDHRPGGWHSSDPRRAWIQNGGADHFSDCSIAAAVAPEDVSLAFPVEISVTH